MTIGLAVFYIWPIAATLYTSLTKTGVFGGSTFVGVANYLQVLESTEVQRALLNTLIYTAVVLISIPIALVLAVLMQTRGLRFVGLFRAVYFVPVITMPVAVAWLWKLIYNGDFGALNALLAIFNTRGHAWLDDPTTALLSISVVGVWTSLGYPVVLFIAALQGVPPELAEAAELDGAGAVRRFFSVTVPLISPTIFFVSILTVIGALQMFDLIFIMIGPQNAIIPQTETIIYLFYKTAFVDNDKGLASAIVFTLMLVIIVLTLIQFRLQRRWVHYE